MFRTILCFIYFVIWLILSTPAILYAKFLEKKHPEKKALFVQKKVNSCFKGLIFFSGAKVTYLGVENIPDDEPVLYVGNHRSIYDVILSFQALKGHSAYVAKKELKKVPILGCWMNLLGCVFIDRDDTRSALKSILDGISLLKGGQSLFIFPEGTRNRGDELSLLPFKEGSMKLAIKSKRKIIPVSFNNAASIFEKQFPFTRKSPIIIEFGEPIDPTTLDKKDQSHLGETLQKIIDEKIHQNSSLL